MRRLQRIGSVKQVNGKEKTDSLTLKPRPNVFSSCCFNIFYEVLMVVALTETSFHNPYYLCEGLMMETSQRTVHDARVSFCFTLYRRQLNNTGVRCFSTLPITIDVSILH